METVDVLIHVHPEFTADDRCNVEKELSACEGVISAHFNQHKHPHALTVLYNPDATQSAKLLDVVRRFDPSSSLVGL